MCATVIIDADFDRQIHNNNNNMRAVKRVHNCIVFFLGKQICYFPIVPSKCKITRKSALKMIGRAQKCPFPKSAPCPLSILAKTLCVEQ